MFEKTPATSVETSSLRFDVFLSHNSREKPVVERIAEKLKRAELEPWLDKWCLTPAGDWQEELAQGLRASKSCAVFIGPSGLGSWEDLEYKLATDRMAKDRAFRVFLVLLPGLPEPFDTSTLPPFLSTRTWIDLRQGIEDKRGVQSLINGIKGLPLGPERPIEPRSDICPYRGLQTFNEEHTEFFFGRDGDIQRLIEKLKTTRFIAVIGSSGSGKSSLVRAGVVPALKKGLLPESDTWTTRVFTPGAHPLAALAANLLRLYPHEAMSRTLDQLSADERTLHLAVSLGLTGRPATERVVWVIDQFEEVFTLCSDERERAQFLANMLYAAMLYAAFIPKGRCAVLLTLRADFYPKCSAYPELSARIAEQQFLVSLMGRDNLRQAIEEPAWHVGLEFEPGLVETILAAVENQPGALPLLEHALLEMWERRQGQMLTLETYRQSGGVEGAVAKRAEAIYLSFNSEQQKVVRRIMLRLTQPGEGTEDTRRRATMSELITRADESEIVEGVAQAMADARLLTTSTNEQLGEQTVDVSHEALIRGWPRLRKWIEEDRAGLRILQRLTEAAREWQTSKDRSLLYRGARLAQAVEWRERNEGVLNDSEREFIDRSVAAQGAAERRRKRIIIGLSAGLIITASFAALAIIQWKRVDNQAQISLAQALAAQSLTQIETEPALAILLAIEANRIHESPETRSVLLRGIQYREHLMTLLHGQTAEVHKIVFSPDGKVLAAASGGDGVDNTVRLWDVDSGQPIGQPLVGHQSDVSYVSFSNDGKILASGDKDGVIILWDMATKEQIGQPLAAHGIIDTLAFSPDDKLLASNSGYLVEGENLGTRSDVVLWDVASRSRIGQLPLGNVASGDYINVSARAFSPNNKLLASGVTSSGSSNDLAAEIIFWNIATREKVGPALKGHEEEVTSLAFSPDGRVLASGSKDKTVKLWDVIAQKPLNLGDFEYQGPQTHTNSVLDVRFIAGGKILVSGDAGNQILMRKVEFSTGSNKPAVVRMELPEAIAGSTNEIRTLAIRPDGSGWATAGCWNFIPNSTCKGEVSIWSATTRIPISHVLSDDSDTERLAFSPDGRTLAVARCTEPTDFGCFAGEVQLRNAATGQFIGQPLKDADSHIESIAYKPDGKILATGGCSEREFANCKVGKIQLWNPETQKLIAIPLTGHTDSVEALFFTPDGKNLISTGGGKVIFWDAQTWQQVGEIIIPDHPVTDLIGHGYSQAIALSDDGKTLASGGCGRPEPASGETSHRCLEGEVRLWDVGTRHAIGEPIAGHGDKVTNLAFSPDGSTLASAAGRFDQTIKVWDTASRQSVGRPFTLQINDVLRIAFSPDGQTLATVSNAESPWSHLVLWDVDSRQMIGQSLTGRPESVSDIAFSPNGRLLASGSNQAVVLWDMSLESWVTTACRIANRNLTPIEWDRYIHNMPYHRTCTNFP